MTSTWRGWDLLRLRTKRAETPWDMSAVARTILTGSETVMDAGCGDGLLLAGMASGFTRGIGVDVSKARVHYARF